MGSSAPSSATPRAPPRGSTRPRCARPGPIKVDEPDRGGAGRRFGTPSGRLEFYSESLAAQGLPAMPDWVADPEEAAQAARFPLRLLTAPGYFQAHTAYAGVASLRKKAGPPECVLHPEDAKARGLRAGEPVELFNDGGAVTFVLRVSDETARRRLRAGAAARVRGPCRHHQHALLDAHERHGRGRDLPEHAARRAPPSRGLMVAALSAP